MYSVCTADSKKQGLVGSRESAYNDKSKPISGKA